MKSSLPGWMVSLLVLLVAGAGLGWWVYSITVTPPLTVTPAVVSSQSPLSSPIIDELRKRTIYGDLPLKDTSPVDRTDPFVKQ